MTRPGRTAAVVFVTAVFVLSGCSANPTGVSPSVPAPSSAATSGPPQQGQGPDVLDPDPHYEAAGAVPVPADAAARRAAEQFVAAWARPDLSPRVWLTGVRSRATPVYAAMLETVEPANIPAHTGLGPARLVTSTERRAEFDVPTDAGLMRVTCVSRDSRWLIATVEAQQ